jgi:hypothetical protein
MNLNWLVVVAGLVTELETDSARAGVTTNSAAFQTNSISRVPGGRLLYPQLRYTNLLAGPTSAFPGPFRFNLPPETVKAATSNSLTPGVYMTEPYACIVVVPGHHLDDAIAVNPTQKTAPMPVIKPELHFIPLKPK